MATRQANQKPVSVEEYLSMPFEQGCEYVEGVLLERTGRCFQESFTVSLLAVKLQNEIEQSGRIGLLSMGSQTGPSRFRVPDLSILREGYKREPILTHPPLLIVEVQSPDQPLRRIENKAIEYLAFGVEHVWVIDPYARVAWRGTPTGLELVRTGELTVPNSRIRIGLEDLFAELDRV